MKKVIALLLVFSVFAFAGCLKAKEPPIATNAPTTNIADEASSKVIKSFITKIYEVKDYEMYKNMKESASSSESAGSASFAEYTKKLEPYTTEKGLESLFTGGIATYMDGVAYDNKFFVEVSDISLKNIKNDSTSLQYQYTVTLKLTKDQKTVSSVGSGNIELAKDADGAYKVDFIQKTDSKAIGEAVAALK